MRNQTIFGNVNADGTIESNADGFSVEKAGTGLYLIKFDQPFGQIPSVSLTQNFPSWNDFNAGGGSTLDNCVIVAVSQQQLKVKTGGDSGDADDRNFSFIVIGQ